MNRSATLSSKVSACGSVPAERNPDSDDVKLTELAAGIHARPLPQKSGRQESLVPPWRNEWGFVPSRSSPAIIASRPVAKATGYFIFTPTPNQLLRSKNSFN